MVPVARNTSSWIEPSNVRRARGDKRIRSCARRALTPLVLHSDHCIQEQRGGHSSRKQESHGHGFFNPLGKILLDALAA